MPETGMVQTVIHVPHITLEQTVPPSVEKLTTTPAMDQGIKSVKLIFIQNRNVMYTVGQNRIFTPAIKQQEIKSVGTVQLELTVKSVQ